MKFIFIIRATSRTKYKYRITIFAEIYLYFIYQLNSFLITGNVCSLSLRIDQFFKKFMKR